MTSKIINREITSIISNYLYNHPLASQTHTDTPSSSFRQITRPLDSYLRSYFSARKYLGSTERSTISDKVYNLVRYEYLLAHLIRSKPFDFEKQYTFGEQMER